MRIYPIRTSKRFWTIPLYSHHECTDWCQFNLTFQQHEPMFQINEQYDAETKQCVNYNRLERCTINILNYNMLFPKAIEGNIYNPDMIVIPETSFKMILYFPFRDQVDIDIQTPNEPTLRVLLELVRQVYVYAYEKEEETSPPSVFDIRESCPCILERATFNKQHMLDEKEKPVSDGLDPCSICYEPFTDKAVELECKHIFHKSCLQHWIDVGDSCPLCRTPFFTCTRCNNERFIEYRREYVVIPQHLRTESVYRNTTNGVFGIHTCDLENLFISEMFYNSERKVLQVTTKSRMY